MRLPWWWWWWCHRKNTRWIVVVSVFCVSFILRESADLQAHVALVERSNFIPFSFFLLSLSTWIVGQLAK